MSQLKVIALGGMGNVTQNMFVYEYEDEILLVDCGIGFPDSYMPGVDILIPDIRYVMEALEKGKRIVGMVFTHGHDDHIAAAPYLLPRLPEFPLFASPLTARFAEERIKDGGITRNVTAVTNTDPVKISNNFSVRFSPVTHSVPDTRHVAISTPEGIIYHGSDFKLDPTPVDGVKTDETTIRAISKEGVLCMMIDCLRVERSEETPSEMTVGPYLDATMKDTQGKYIITLMSSHIHRIQQAVDAAHTHNRKVAFIGRSVEQNVRLAIDLKKLEIPKGVMIDKREMADFKDSELCVIVAGSQGQEGSSLMRAIYGEHPMLEIRQNDTVVFSADAIPGNEMGYYEAIDELTRNRVHVLYPSIMPGLHSSGHASMPEQRTVLSWVQPKYVMPVGGADRHRYKFHELVAAPLGYAQNQVLVPKSGEILGFEGGQVSSVDTLTLQPQIVDGLGIGDVGPVVLSDRRTLGQAGIVVVVMPRHKREFLLRELEVVSRGFIFMKDAEEVVEYIKQTVAEIVAETKGQIKDEELRRLVERRLSRKLYKIIQREPMIVSVILDV
jgi:ribonuclease J